jgi:predicted ATPase/DNA-binding CsgD family transcriptional regulator
MDASLERLTGPTHILPGRLTSFVGREREIADIVRLLGEVRLVTLVGAPGVGKTRLALRVAGDVVDTFPEGVWFVELAPLADPSLVPRAVATTLGVREQPGRSMLATLAEALAVRELLLVLDNCEHLVGACASLVEDLLRTCPGLRVLATSREALRIEGEAAYRVPSLGLPDPRPPADGSDLVSHLMDYESVRLFVDRARAALPTFELTGRDAAAVGEICRRLDGIPLAIELAAARVPGLAPSQIAARLDDAFRLLAGGSRTALSRQRTLRALIDWSHDLLTEPERTLLRRLAVFAGGWTLEAAEGVCSGGGVEAPEVLDLLLALVDKSLVVAEEHGQQMRYRLLETIRQYGAEHQRAAGEDGALRTRHLDWFLALAETAWPELTGPEQGQWLDRLEREHDNFRAALAWSQEASDPEAGLRLAWALYRFWWWRGHLSEGRRWLARALERDVPRRGQARARALNAAAVLARAQADYTPARSLFEESLAIFRELGDRWGIANALQNLGSVSLLQGDYAAAATLIDESLALWRELGDTWGIGVALGMRGALALDLRDYERAGPLLEESLALGQKLGDTWTIAGQLGILAELAREQGQYERARALLEALSLGQELGDRGGVAWSLSQLGRVACKQGDYKEAIALCRESLRIFRERGESWGIAMCLESLARVAGATGQPEHAARLFGAAGTIREVIGFAVPPALQGRHLASHEQNVATVRSELAEGAFARAWAEGRATSLEQAIELALAPLEPAGPPDRAPHPSSVVDSSSPLTRREQEVAALVARGLTNRQVAEALVISERTASTHVTNILGKLGFATRAQVAAWAARQGLTAPDEA